MREGWWYYFGVQVEESTSGNRIGNIVARRVDIKISHHKKT